MLTPRTGLVSVAAACVIAAGTGAYLATRQLNAPANAEIHAPAPSQVSPVHETEALLEEPARTEEPTRTEEPAAPAVGASPPPQAPAPERRAAPRAPTPRATPAARPAQTREASRPARTQVPPPPVPQTPEPAWDEAEAAAVERYEPVTVPELPRPVEQARVPQRELEELVVDADSVVGLRFDSTVTSDTAQIEDRVSARVSRDVTVNGRVAIPAGSRVLGAVTLVDRGGKVKERARLGVRFHTLVLADGTSLPIQTETVYRDGESPANRSAAKIGGGAIGGAIIGGILGGARGAVIGGSTGAAGGTAAVMAGGRRAAAIASGSSMTVRVLSPVTVTVER